MITHAHGDHARGGTEACVGSHAGLPLLRRPRGEDYGRRFRMGRAWVSLHPAGDS